MIDWIVCLVIYLNLFLFEDFIGEFRASFSELASKNTFDLINAKKQGKRGYKNSGTFMVLKALAVKVEQEKKIYFFFKKNVCKGVFFC